MDDPRVLKGGEWMDMILGEGSQSYTKGMCACGRNRQLRGGPCPVCRDPEAWRERVEKHLAAIRAGGERKDDEKET
jgi:hypothetical protein